MSTTAPRFADEQARDEARRHGFTLAQVLETLGIRPGASHLVTVRDVDLTRFALADVDKSRAHFDPVHDVTPTRVDPDYLQRVADHASYVEHGSAQ